MNNNQFFLILHIISIDDLKTVDDKRYFASYFQNQFYLNDQDHRYGYNGLFMWTRCVCIEGKLFLQNFE